jgi:hypothetical protein
MSLVLNQIHWVALKSGNFLFASKIENQALGAILKVNVSLVDLSTGLQILGDSYKTDCKPSELIEFQEEVAHTIMAKISCKYGIFSKTLSHESKQHPPSKLKTYDAMLRYYEFNAHFSV